MDTFNNDQMTVAKSLIDHLSTQKTPFVINARAGTGKTYMLVHLFKNYFPSDKTVFVAFTNKAVEVINSIIRDSYGITRNMLATTIHKFLKLAPFYDDNGGLHFCETQKYYTKESDYLVVDEASMIPKRLYEILQKYVSATGTKIVYAGDVCQIPPQNEKKSQVFIDNITSHKMTKIMRTADIDLMNVLEFFRSRQEDYEFPETRDNWKLYRSKSCVVINEEYEFMEYCKMSFIENMLRDKSACKNLKIITYTNKKADFYNYFIRYELLKKNIIHIDRYHPEYYKIVDFNSQCVGYEMFAKLEDPEASISRFYIGEKLMFSTFYQDLWGKKYYTEDAVNVETIRVVIIKPILSEYKVYLINETFPVIHEDSQSQYFSDMSTLKAECSLSRKWRPYKLLEQFNCPLVYSYSITSDKTQGSTYDNCYVDAKDIGMIKDPQSCFKRLYVACSRAKLTLTVFLPVK